MIGREWCTTKEVKKLRRELRKGLGLVMSAITDFAAKVKVSFDEVTASLDNIVSDEAKLAKQITDLQAQIAAGGSTLTAEDQAALDNVVAESQAAADRTKSIADNVPDTPVI